MARFQCLGEQRRGRRQICADELVARARRRDPYGAIETTARVRQGIEDVRIKVSAGLGRGESSNRRSRCARVVMHEDNRLKLGWSFPDTTGPSCTCREREVTTVRRGNGYESGGFRFKASLRG